MAAADQASGEAAERIRRPLRLLTVAGRDTPGNTLATGVARRVPGPTSVPPAASQRAFRLPTRCLPSTRPQTTHPRDHQPGRAGPAWPRPITRPTPSSGPAAPRRERLHPRRASTASCGTRHTDREIFSTPREAQTPQSRADTEPTANPQPSPHTHKPARLLPTLTASRSHHSRGRAKEGSPHGTNISPGTNTGGRSRGWRVSVGVGVGGWWRGAVVWSGWGRVGGCQAGCPVVAVGATVGSWVWAACLGPGCRLVALRGTEGG